MSSRNTLTLVAIFAGAMLTGACANDLAGPEQVPDTQVPADPVPIPYPHADPVTWEAGDSQAEAPWRAKEAESEVSD